MEPRLATWAEILAGRAGAILLCAGVFALLLGLHAAGKGSAESNALMQTFGGALLGALSNDMMQKAKTVNVSTSPDSVTPVNVTQTDK